MIEVEWDQRLLDETRAWVAEACTPDEDLAEAVGIAPPTLDQLRGSGLVPAATYELSPRGVASPVARMGEALRGPRYYGPALVAWLRRCAAHLEVRGPEGVQTSLLDWLRADLARALRGNATEARLFGWAHLFDSQGRLDEAALDQAARQLWDEWLGGGWAVCLHRFDGHHVVVKDIELERIPALARRLESDRAVLPELIDAMLRYDSVARPFAPFERGMSSRRRVIDNVANALTLPWPRDRSSVPAPRSLADARCP